jgi:hypothetical protein
MVNATIATNPPMTVDVQMTDEAMIQMDVLVLSNLV